MKIREFMKKSKVFILICALTVPILHLTNISAADSIDTAAQCSLTLTVPADSVYSSDTGAPDFTAKLYRVASVSESRHFTMLGDYGVDVEALSEDDNTDWENAAATASKKLDGKKATAEVVISKETGQGTANGLETGMYLVMMDTVTAPEYEYSFTPYFISLPNNLYYSSGEAADDEWIYDAQSVIKVGAEQRFGSLEIVKTLTEYNSTLGPATFVFSIEGVKGTDKYSNVVSLNFSEAGEQSVVVENIPVGMEVTVTEVYSGSSYELTTAASQSTVIAADEAERAGVAFTNTYNESINGGYGVENQFNHDEDGWHWNQKVIE